MKIHDLKCNGASFDLIRSGAKRADVRLNDRDYQRQDILILRRLTDDGEYSTVHDPQMVRITSVLPGGQYGIEHGYVLLSIERVFLQAAS